MTRPTIILMAMVWSLGLAGAVRAQELADAQFDLGAGRYADASGPDLSATLLRRASERYDPDARPIANFQTADTGFNTIMNRIANNPGPHACATEDERAYVQHYVASHPQMENTVRANDLTYTCPGASGPELLSVE